MRRVGEFAVNVVVTGMEVGCVHLKAADFNSNVPRNVNEFPTRSLVWICVIDDHRFSLLQSLLNRCDALLHGVESVAINNFIAFEMSSGEVTFARSRN